MTDIHQSGYGATTFSKQKSRPENSINKIMIDYNHNCDIGKMEKFKHMLQFISTKSNLFTIFQNIIENLQTFIDCSSA